MFLHVCVCPQGGGGLPRQVPPRTRYTPLGPGTPPRTRYTPQDQVPPRPGTHPRTRYTPRNQLHPPGSGTPPPDQVPPRDQVSPPPRDGYCCGRYASYWNAFLSCRYLLIYMRKGFKRIHSHRYPTSNCFQIDRDICVVFKIFSKVSSRKSPKEPNI